MLLRVNVRLQALFDAPMGHSSRIGVGMGRVLPFGYGFFRDESGTGGAAERGMRWMDVSRATIAQASGLAASVSRAADETGAPLPVTVCVKRLDALSDALCATLDATELWQNVATTREEVDDARAANALLSTFMNELNTDTKLYQSLNRSIHAYKSRTIDQPRADEQTLVVADLLMKDFQKSGIHLSGSQRDSFVKLSDDILNLGFKFVRSSAESACEGIEIENPAERLLGVHPHIVQAVTKSNRNMALIPIDGTGTANHILRSARDADVRRAVFMGMNEGSDETVHYLEELLRRRRDLAVLLGKKSYAEMWLADKMAGSTETVMKFLNQVSSQNKPHAQTEIARLASLKQSQLQTATTPPIHAWDKPFYAQFIGPATRAANPDALRPYFSVGRTIAGVSAVLERLYGVCLEPAEVQTGEVWAADVRKVHVLREGEGIIGVLYLDLFQREAGVEVDKFDGAAQFTVRCSRRLDDGQGGARRVGLRSLETEKRLPDGSLYQLPIVALVTQFERPREGGAVPGLLALSEVETLFHEMGHVLHSVLARTDYQHISGTRCALDFVEVPSNILESFARDPDVLKAIGVHYRTGEPVPAELVDGVRERQGILEAVERQAQVKMAVLDQLYHSEHMEDANFNTTALLSRVQNEVDVIPYVPGTRWQTQFTHLFSYGASYYSYFWARRVSDAVCKNVFREDARGTDGRPLHRLDTLREGGEVVRGELLKWGGGRSPWIGLEKAGVGMESL
ncbi:hypothetical protein BC830DRAFT_1134602 [Chytriomyces sp. MP71]|nr:hypothetical protein BC830DRAFT_1134602 [Chytriomyces sp. MP71]